MVDIGLLYTRIKKNVDIGTAAFVDMFYSSVNQAYIYLFGVTVNCGHVYLSTRH